MIELETPRLIMRQWTPEDLPALASLNADSEVMRFFPAVLSSEQSAQMLERLRGQFAAQGYGFWALQQKGSGQLIGFTGLNRVGFEASFSSATNPAAEIGWRLAREYWHQGYASEAARTALDCAFSQLQLPEVVAFTAEVNGPSIQLMQALGMQHSSREDFEHPALPVGHWLSRHVLYRITHEDWLAAPRKT
ncbi:Putative enzyme [Pseudomonas marincola]|uniref:Putative enzyme n=1 Tax=Pseudomonas marincola TaxID=437900 RepID=A0A653DYS2_9PSED|nr:GNAT family N-acetyltransferase [Pseudomonas marincola]CAE6938054.1 Putative enzyme [Pseudomonas marincola]